MIDFPKPPPDLKLIGSGMPRARHQNGWVERTGRKRKTWTGYWYEYARQEDGSEKRLQRSKVLGPCAEMTKGAAEDKLRDILRDERPPQTNATFEQLAQWYLKTNEGRWSKRWNGVLRCIFRYQILPRLGSRIASELKKSDIQRAINDIAADPKSQSASIVQKSLTHIRAVLHQAIEDELLDRNPAVKVDMPHVRRPSERFLTLEECQRLLAVATARDRIIIRLFMVCGLRPSELFALRVNDIFRVSCESMKRLCFAGLQITPKPKARAQTCLSRPHLRVSYRRTLRPRASRPMISYFRARPAPRYHPTITSIACCSHLANWRRSRGSTTRCCDAQPEHTFRSTGG